MVTQSDSQAEELGKLFGRPKSRAYAGKTVELRPFEFEQLDLVLEAAQPFIAELINSDESRLAIYRKHKDAVFGLVSILSGEPVEWIRKLPAFVGLTLFTDCIEVNSDFFSQGLPQLTQLMRLLPQSVKSLSAGLATPSALKPAPEADAGAASSSSVTGSASPNG